MEVLDAAAIDVPGMRVRVLGQCTSTNELLLNDRTHDVLLAAEEQTAGRGRRGRRWRSSAGKGATFSMAKLVRRPLHQLGGLSPAGGGRGAAAAPAPRRGRGGPQRAHGPPPRGGQHRGTSVNSP